MNLDRLYDLAENEHIKIYDWHIEDCNGIFLNYDKINAIALNYDELGTYIDEKCTLAHELGHYFTDSIYRFSDDKILKDKAEYRTKNWAYSVLIPFKVLKEKILNGFDIYQLAEYFEVTIEYMQNAIEFYKSKYGFIY